MGRIIEGIWNCKSCGTQGIGASKKTCPNCGAVQESYSLPSQMKYVDKSTADKVRNTGPDWYCSYCEIFNASYEETCSGCGSSKSQSEMNYFERKKELEERKNESNKNFEDSFVEEESSNISPPIKNPVGRSTRSFDKTFFPKIIKYLPFVAIFALVVFLISGCFMKIPHEETITGFSWERTVEVEDFKTFEEDGWSLPSDGRLLYSQEEIRRYDNVIDHYEIKKVEKSREVVDHYETVEVEKSRQVIDYYKEVVTGYKDLGNGYYEEIVDKEPVYKTEYYTEKEEKPVYKKEYYTEEIKEPVYVQVPVYDTKYYYEIDRWVHNRNEKTSGNDKSPYWAEPKLLDNQRFGSRQEKYTIYTLNEDGETNSYHFEESEWMTYSQGDVIYFTTNLYGFVNSETIQKME